MGAGDLISVAISSKKKAAPIESDNNSTAPPESVKGRISRVIFVSRRGSGRLTSSPKEMERAKIANQIILIHESVYNNAMTFGKKHFKIGDRTWKEIAGAVIGDKTINSNNDQSQSVYHITNLQQFSHPDLGHGERLGIGEDMSRTQKAAAKITGSVTIGTFATKEISNELARLANVIGMFHTHPFSGPGDREGFSSADKKEFSVLVSANNPSSVLRNAAHLQILARAKGAGWNALPLINKPYNAIFKGVGKPAPLLSIYVNDEGKIEQIPILVYR